MSDEAAAPAPGASEESPEEEDELSQVRRELAESQQERAKEKEEFEGKMQDIRQKTKVHMTKFQEKTQAVIQQKDSQFSELEAAKAEALAEIALLKNSQSGGGVSEIASLEAVARADSAEAMAKELERELASLKERLRLQEENAVQPPLEQCGGDDEQLRLCRLELQEAKVDAQAQSAVSEKVKAELAELQEEMARLKQETQTKISEVVLKAKEHVKQVQTRLEAQVSECKQLQICIEAKEAENKELTDKFREVDDAYAQQADKLNKYKQLMAQANARIEDGDDSAKDCRESLEKLQKEHEMLKLQHDGAEKSCVPPTREEIKALGGVQLTVEAENENVWCLLNNGNDNVGSGDHIPTLTSRRRWWLLSQLDTDDKPIPLQRRWKGEVSALRAQTARAKKRSEDIQEEFEAYKQKANAALQTGANQSEDTLLRERKFEQLGQQLQATASELQQVQSEKAKVFDDLGEVRRRLQEVTVQKTELEHTLEHRLREAQQAQESAVVACTRDLESEREKLAQKWREKERSYLQELDLRRAQKESLDEEIESLRTRLATRISSAPISLERAESDSEDGRVPPALASREGDVARPGSGATTPPRGQALERLGGTPLDNGVWRGTRPSPRSSPRPSPRNGDAPAVSSSAHPPAAHVSEGQGGLAAPAAPGDESAASSSLLPQAYSLHASVAWQDLVSLRAQVRQLEATLQDQKQQNSVLERDKEKVLTEMREVEEQQKLTDVVGQHQQMEYIRNVFRKFVETLPAGQAEHEQLIPVLMTFFQFGPEENRAIASKRAQNKPQGLWGSLGWRG